MHLDLFLGKRRLAFAGLALSILACKPPTGTVAGTVALEGGGSPAGALVVAGGRVTAAAADGSFSIAELPVGTVTVRASHEGFVAQEQPVTVENGREASVSFTLALPPPGGSNRPPVLSALSAAPSQLPRGGTASVRAVAVDPDGDGLTYTWTATGGFTVTGTADGTATLGAPRTSGASGSVQVVVDDGKGGTATGVLLVSTAPNGSPLLASLTATPPTVARGGTVTLAASASDPEGDTLSYAWTAPGGWTLSANGASATAVAPAAGGVTGVFQLEVTDGNGGAARGAVVVTTAANAAPVLTSITATPPSVQKGGDIALHASATDPDGEALAFQWAVPAGWSLNGTGSDVVVTAPATPATSAAIDVQVTDASGSSTRGSVVVSTRPNTTPQVASITATPAPVQRGGDIAVDVSATDPDGDPLSYAWTVPAGWAVAGSGATVIVTSPAAPGQRATVNVVVSDGFGGSISGSIAVSTAPNEPPQLAPLSALPNPVVKGGTVTLVAGATDPDGDSLGYEWTPPAGWTLGGTGSTVSLVAPATAGTSGTVGLVVSDAFGGSVSGSLVVSTLANSPPQLASVSTTPLPAPRGGTVVVRASANDSDGDSLSYGWSVDDPAWALTPNGAEATLVAPDAPGASAVVTVDVTDGQGGSVSGTVTVSTPANFAPYIVDLQATPTPLLPGASLTASVDARDLDGDPLTFAWTSTPPSWVVTGSGASVSFRAPFVNDTSATIDVAVSDPHGGQVTRGVPVATSSCPLNTMNCDGNTANGCEVNLQSDPNNCSSCGNVCPPATPSCVLGSCSSRASWSGVRNDVPISEITGGGWSQCHVSMYDTATLLSTILAACNKANLMLACRPTGGTTLRLAAHAPRADVIFDTGTGNVPHNANGVGWYFNSNFSWGFAPQGVALYRNSCDVNESGLYGGTPPGPTANQRLCNHTGSGSQTTGWRCGNQVELNFSTAWERLVFHAD